MEFYVNVSMTQHELSHFTDTIKSVRRTVMEERYRLPEGIPLEVMKSLQLKEDEMKIYHARDDMYFVSLPVCFEPEHIDHYIPWLETIYWKLGSVGFSMVRMLERYRLMMAA